jgi:hypothetical protein
MYCSVSEWSLLLKSFKTDGKVKNKNTTSCNSNRKHNSGTQMAKDLYCIQTKEGNMNCFTKEVTYFSFTAPPRTNYKNTKC